MKSEYGNKVPHNNYDIIFKAMTEQFGQKALDFYGIDTPAIVRVVPTDLPIVNVNERRMDFVFLLSDDSYLHLEFQTTFRRKDLERFKLYDAVLYNEQKQKIRTFVVYGADVEKAEEHVDHGSIQYTAKAIYMKDYNGDETIQELSQKVKDQESLTDDDQLRLIFLPLMDTRLDRTDLAVETVEMANQVNNEGQRFRLTATVIAIADKFLDESYVNKMMEVFKMTRIFREVYEEAEADGFEKGEAKGEEKGIAKGKQEAIQQYLESRFGKESANLKGQLEQISEIDILNSLIAKVYRTETIEEAERLINQALQFQNVG